MLPLIAQREARAAAVRQAQYNLSRCRVLAPFDARVTELTISEGAYAHTGQRVFTLIDVRNWWVIGNFPRVAIEVHSPGRAGGSLRHVQTKPAFHGRSGKHSFGVTPEETGMGGALPQVQRSLAWVHLASRFPVRVRVYKPEPDLFRIGESGYVIVRGSGTARNDKRWRRSPSQWLHPTFRAGG